MLRRDLPLPLTISPEAAQVAHQAENTTHRWPLTPRITARLRASGLRSRRDALHRLARTTGVDITASQVSVDVDGVAVTSLVLTPSTPRWTADEGGADTPSPDLASAQPWVFWIHGGGFCWGSALDAAAVRLAADLGVPVVSVEYPLAPEHPYPAGLDGCLAAYRAHVRAWGPRVILGGQSAGANLALGVLQRLRAEAGSDDGPEPLGLIAATPFGDLAGRGDSYSANEGRDPVVRWSGQQERFAKAYRADTPATDPFVSPVHARWDAPAPPILITSGTRDLFLSDAVQIAAALRAAGGEVELRIWEGMWHAFENDASSPEARECLRLRADFGRAALGLADPA